MRDFLKLQLLVSKFCAGFAIFALMQHDYTWCTLFSGFAILTYPNWTNCQ